jgi:hypothetical protein
MSGPPRDPKSGQSRGDLKISLTPAGLFVVAMIVFFYRRRNIRLHSAADSLTAEQSRSTAEHSEIWLPDFFQGAGHIGDTIHIACLADTDGDAKTNGISGDTNAHHNSGDADSDCLSRADHAVANS